MEKKMKEVLMQYPFALDLNSKFDGKLHKIAIEDLVKININGDVYYEMEYFDQTLDNKKMYAYLKMINGVLCNVPLRKYNPLELHIFLGNCPRKKLSDSELELFVPKVIGVSEIATCKDILNNKEIKANNVTMNYPYDALSKVIDGNIHDITPINVDRLDVNGFDLYFMSYFDNVLKHIMVAFLIKIDNQIYEVPLTCYNLAEMKNFINKYKVSNVDISDILPPGTYIDLAQTLSLEDFSCFSRSDNKTVVDFPLYIAYNKENPMDIADKVFRSCCRIYRNKDKDCMFDKNREGKAITDAIRAAISNNLSRCMNGESFFVDVEVDVPVGATATVPTEDGRVVFVKYISGIHKRHIYLTPSLYKELEIPTRLCERIKVRTTLNDKRTNAALFKEGYNEALPITFDKLPAQYEGRHQTSFYRVSAAKDVVTKAVANNEKQDYFADPAVAELKDMYLNTMNSVYASIDNVIYDDNYAENYRAMMINSIINTLRNLGKNENTIKAIVSEIQATA